MRSSRAGRDAPCTCARCRRMIYQLRVARCIKARVTGVAEVRVPAGLVGWEAGMVVAVEVLWVGGAGVEGKGWLGGGEGEGDGGGEEEEERGGGGEGE
jgi:hypothetical protein